MKTEKAKFNVGDIVINEGNGWKRQIQQVIQENVNGNLKISYIYYNEELNLIYEPTGKFNPDSVGRCSQQSLLSWQQGR